ncbi:hypothetical protein LCGC14_0359510 [marine sediment metagenome]|uniref:DOD-type homing endonuclease domain-containing protein n=1 Tax=marine sediment metagenome TaxID=412755 RepID=A0A0F9VVR4_9ZZZZ|nr:hypothetical protein [Candidatus Aminicenantes bacterium]
MAKKRFKKPKPKDIEIYPFDPHPQIHVPKGHNGWEGYDPKIHKTWYQTNYLELFREIKRDPDTAIPKLRQILISDLWFICYFIMPLPDEVKELLNQPFTVGYAGKIQNGPITGTLDLVAREHFKAVDINENVFTSEGWKKHGSLKVGDKIYGSNGNLYNVTERTEIFTSADCYRVVFDDGYSVVVSGEHLWAVEKRGHHKREPMIIETKKLYKHQHKPDRRYAVKVNAPLKSSLRFFELLPIDPYTLGAWLGDGTRMDGVLTCQDKEVFDRISEFFIVGKGRPSKPITKTIKGLKVKLRNQQLLDNKHIPERYFRASERDRVSLLQGLMDTDGTCNPRGTATFVNKNFRLASDVHMLCCTLGLKPQFNSFSQDHGVVYYVSFQAYKKYPIFHLKRKLKNCKSGDRVARRFIKDVFKVLSIPVSCITVDSPDGCYLIGKSMVTTHNSTFITIGETIQYNMQFPNNANAIFSYNRATSKRFLREIKQIYENEDHPGCRLLRMMFPDVLWSDPKAQAPKWSEDEGLVLKRKTVSRHSTIEAWGLLDGMPTGGHYHRRIYDDLVTEDIAASPGEMEKVKFKFDSSQNLGVMAGGRHRVAGTIYAYDDPNCYVRDKIEIINGEEKPVYHTRLYPATDDGTPDGNPVLVSPERLQELKNTQTFYCQQLLDPVPVGEAKLDPAMFIDIEPEMIPHKLFKFVIVDPAGDKETQKGEDDWAIHLLGVEPYMDDIGASNVYLLNSKIEKFAHAQAIDAICKMYIDGGRVECIGVEKVGLSSVEIHVANAMKEKGRFLSTKDGSIRILTPAGRQKDGRIMQGMDWPLKNGKLHISKSVPKAYRDRILQEARFFPKWSKKDGLDAWSYLWDILLDFSFLFRSENDEDDRDAEKRDVEANEFDPLRA